MKRYALSAIFGLALLPVATAPASASIAAMTQPAMAADDNSMVIQVQRRGGGARVGGARVGGARVGGARVGVARVGGARVGVGRVGVGRVGVARVGAVGVAGRGLYRGGYVYRGGPWSRPRAYWWPVGGAIAAGAALGVVAASSAYWAGPAPGPGYCWYYTDPSQRQGFWDACQ